MLSQPFEYPFLISKTINYDFSVQGKSINFFFLLMKIYQYDSKTQRYRCSYLIKQNDYKNIPGIEKLMFFVCVNFIFYFIEKYMALSKQYSDRMNLGKSSSLRLLNFNTVDDPGKGLFTSRLSTGQLSRKIQNFYFSLMVKAFDQSEKKYPDPIQILEAIKQKERKVKEFQIENQKLKQKLKIKDLQKAIGSKPITHIIKNQDNISLSSAGLTKFQELIFRLKLKLCSSLQELGIEKAKIKQFQTTKDNFLVEEYVHLIKSNQRVFQLQIQQLSKTNQQVKENSINQLSQILQLKAQNQQYTQIEKTLKEKIKIINLEKVKFYEERKIFEKQNSQLHHQLYEERLKNQEYSRVIENLQKRIRQFEKNSLKIDIETDNQKVSQVKAFPSPYKNEQVFERMSQYKQKYQYLKQQNVKLNKQLLKWRQRAQWLSQDQGKEGKQQKKTFGKQSCEGNEDYEKIKSERDYLRTKVNEGNQDQELLIKQKIIQNANQWKKYLEKMVEDYEMKLQEKSREIESIKSSQNHQEVFSQLQEKEKTISELKKQLQEQKLFKENEKQMQNKIKQLHQQMKIKEQQLEASQQAKFTIQEEFAKVKSQLEKKIQQGYESVTPKNKHIYGQLLEKEKIILQLRKQISSYQQKNEQEKIMQKQITELKKNNEHKEKIINELQKMKEKANGDSQEK